MYLVGHGLVIFVLFLLSAFFSGIETALFSLSPVNLERIRAKNPRRADRLSLFLKNPNSTVNIIITGNTLVNVAFSVVWASVFIDLFGPQGLLLSVILGTLLLLIFAEFTPKVLAITWNESFSYYGIGMLSLFEKLLRPVSVWFERVLETVFSAFGADTKRLDLALSEDEVEALLDLGERDGVLAEAERDMLEEAMDLDVRTVDEIMTPRVDIVGIDVLSSLEEIKRVSQKARYSRLIVYKGSIDYVLGYIRLKEVLLHVEKDWRSFMRKAIMIPETKSLDRLLHDFKEFDEDLAVVVDEYGGTAGIVTLEDVVEELVGNIKDEFDREPVDIIRRSDGAFIVSGMMSLRDLSEELNIDFDVEDVDTVAGFVMHKLGYVPKGGERFLYKNWVWEVDKVKGNRIEKILLRPS